MLLEVNVDCVFNVELLLHEGALLLKKQKRYFHLQVIKI